ERAEPGTRAETSRLRPMIEALGPQARVPLVDLTLPALRQLSAAQYQTFHQTVDQLVTADRRISLFEFALQRMLLRHLDRHFRKRPPSPTKYTDLGSVLDDCAVLLSSLAY